MTATIRAIPLGIDNVYVVRDDRVILVDGGEPGKFGSLVSGLRKASVTPAEIGLVVATHGHWDHIGCLAEMKQYTGAPLAMHASDRASIEAPKPVMPPGVTPWGRFVSALLTATLIPRLKIPATTVDVVVPDDGLSLEPYGVHGRVLHTPGHTPGSVSIVLDSGDAIVGDLAMNRIPLRLSPGLPSREQEAPDECGRRAEVAMACLTDRRGQRGRLTRSPAFLLQGQQAAPAVHDGWLERPCL